MQKHAGAQCMPRAGSQYIHLCANKFAFAISLFRDWLHRNRRLLESYYDFLHKIVGHYLAVAELGNVLDMPKEPGFVS